jgi:flagellar protein FliO/FliZ
MSSALSSLLWFAFVVGLIPLALWLLKRSRLVPLASSGPMRSVASLPIAPGQRLVTVEVGSGEERRWLVLGVTAQSITTLHSMPPQAELPPPPPPPSFEQMLATLRGRRPAPRSSDAP